MPHYMTRHLEASTDLVHGDRLVAKGERFQATDTDADYYIQHRKAVEAQGDGAVQKSAKQAPPPQPAATVQANKKRAAAAAADAEQTEPVTRKKRERAAPAEQKPAESMIMTSRDVPGPGQDAAHDATPGSAAPADVNPTQAS